MNEKPSRRRFESGTNSCRDGAIKHSRLFLRIRKRNIFLTFERNTIVGSTLCQPLRGLQRKELNPPPPLVLNVTLCTREWKLIALLRELLNCIYALMVSFGKFPLMMLFVRALFNIMNFLFFSHLDNIFHLYNIIFYIR